MKLGQRLKKAREAEGLSLRDLGRRLGISYSYLGYIESGKRHPQGLCAERIANFLKISLEELLRLIAEEDLEEKISKTKQLQNPRTDKPRLLSREYIEKIALNDRTTFLQRVGRKMFVFPTDRNVIPRILYGLKVIDDVDMLFRREGPRIYAGLYPGHFDFQGENNVIVVAAQAMKKGFKELVSKKTLTFQILHEVGHYRLHWLDSYDDTSQLVTNTPLWCSAGKKDDEPLTPEEFQANTYASAFLMPREELFSMLDGRKVFRMSLEGRNFCDYFFVEPHMLEQRLKSLGIRVKY